MADVIAEDGSEDDCADDEGGCGLEVHPSWTTAMAEFESSNAESEEEGLEEEEEEAS